MKGKEDVIVLDKNYTLKKDPHCWVLLYQATKDGKLVAYDPLYFPTVAAALKKYLDLNLKAAADIKQMADLLKETYDRIEKICKNCS
jgi:hypothetical protein